MSGTSCATPARLSPLTARSTLRHPSPRFRLSTSVQTVAGIISLLNDLLVSNGELPLGFLNPWLYGAGLDSLNDILSGSNPRCGTKGFSAIQGWDPVRSAGLLTLHFRCWLTLESLVRQGNRLAVTPRISGIEQRGLSRHLDLAHNTLQNLPPPVRERRGIGMRG